MPDTFPLDVNALLPVLNYLNLGVYITDLQRRIVLWNRKAEEMTGYPAADVVGKACHDDVLCHVDKNGQPLCSTRLCPLHRAIVTNSESSEPVLLYAKKSDWQRVALSVSVAPLRDEAGRVIGGIEAFRDETLQVRDLEFAKTIQQHLLPQSLPAAANIAFDVGYYPHDLIGGDFYDVRDLGENRHGVLVADVRGHGVSAALYTMWLKSLSESLSANAAAPGDFMTALNRELSRFVVDESFATAFYAVVDAARGAIAYSNAGHPGPLHFHAAADEVAALETHDMPLGMWEEETYESATVTLKPGDLLLCYTDGVTESLDKQGDMLGEEGLTKLLREEISKGAANLLERLYRKVLDNCGSVSLGDDVLLLSITHTGEPPKQA